mmetsp:Transcript_15462/g.35328  ORF Transcript_15462/g.35328 Transcript_15462/m.35328 type:complete len:389 (+) Transcript_15462:67-1233(+)|eukprot:5314993-Amphidinium_carterae.1
MADGTAEATDMAVADGTAEATDMTHEDSTVEAPGPPQPGDGPSERRARVEMPPPEEDSGPTYYRIGEDYPLEADEAEIHLQCARIKKLENLETVGPRLKKLVLIANCIDKMENLETNVNLVHLELYQNLVKKIDNIAHLQHLTVLDLSFNKIRSMAYLAGCDFPRLDHLYLSSNKIEEIEGVFHFRTLRLLELGCNRLRGVPQDLSSLEDLEELWLGKNKIVSMALPPLPKLRKCSMQNNRLEVWDAALFANAPKLTHLYMGHNNLPDLPDDVAKLTELVEIDLARNAITLIRPFPQLGKLEELWLNDNQVASMDEVSNLRAFPALRTVYLERNPIHGLGNPASEERYKEAILQAVPDLAQLDALRLNHEIKVITDGSEANIRGIRKR